MSVYESNTVVFHGVTAESRKTIHSFLQGYLDLFKKNFGEDKMDGYIYIGGIPTCEFDLDMDYEPFPRDEGYYVVGISPRWAKARYWENAPGFFGIFLEQKLCTKITWHQYWDQGQPNRIYMNDSTENVPPSWKYYEFVPGENGVPAEYDEENEDEGGEAFNQYVNAVMKGELEVEWRDGFPDYWHDRYDELESRRDREDTDFDDNDDGNCGNDDENDDDGDGLNDSGSDPVSPFGSKPGTAGSPGKMNFFADSGDVAGAMAAQHEKDMQSMQQRLQKQMEQMKARQQKYDSALRSQMDQFGVNPMDPSKKVLPPSGGHPAAGETGEAAVCPVCHSPIGKGWRFCENCGAKI